MIPLMHDASRSGSLTPQQFVAKWSAVKLPERAASHEHFLDLVRLLGQPTPAAHDATGAEYTFEKGVTVTDSASRGSKGDYGYADVWWAGKFAWEYKRKGKHKDLADAYRQLCQYRDALGNPPLLVVCDIDRIEIHTNFTGYIPVVHKIALADLAEPENLDKLRRIFTDPHSFKPALTTEQVTRDVADDFGKLAASLRGRHRDADPLDIAHFLMKCMFCLFAEDVDLLPRNLFKRLLSQSHNTPEKLPDRMRQLFDAMAHGGDFGVDPIEYFNGGLFKAGPIFALSSAEIGMLLICAGKDWSAVDPSIFGTLFERSLDPAKRAQIGAHYTSRDDILLVIEPVIMRPLRKQWEGVRDNVDKQLDRRRKAGTATTKRKADDEIANLLGEFMKHLGSVRILDPACGSGNFLYVAIQQLLDLEREVIAFAAQPEIGIGLLPNVRPTQLHGIEINPFAAELAQVVIWIGYLQWMRDNGFNVPRNPILEDLQTIECRDAILSFESTPQTTWATGKSVDELSKGQPAPWPDAHFIVGNPPFLGSKLFRQQGLDDNYISAMYAAYAIPNSSDLCCYWFERARLALEFSKSYGGKGWGLVPWGFGPWGEAPAVNLRVGLLATQAIRGGSNRKVLERIKETGDIFMAWSDREWVLDGANVQVSMVGFDNATEHDRCLDGMATGVINCDLSGGIPLTNAVKLRANRGIGFMGDTKGGPFDIEHNEARHLLTLPNPNGRPNLDVLRPWTNGMDVTRRPRAMWIIDFDCEATRDESALYESPFAYVEKLVQESRRTTRQTRESQTWWQHVRPRPEMRKALGNQAYIATPNLTKHRLFVRFNGASLPDHQLIAFARSDDYFFGVLHSSVHELWALRMGTQLEDRPRYTPTTCFETFVLPWPPGSEPEGDPLQAAIADAAKELNVLRENWLNPPEWIEPIAKQVDAADDFADVPEDARPLIRQSAIMAAAAKDPRLKKRTLTNLYNQRPTWLKLAHEKLDRAVLAAYAAVDPDGGWDQDWAQVWSETGAGQPLPEGHPLAERRVEVEQVVLGNLLRLNQARS